jgi:hypothetical protein
MERGYVVEGPPEFYIRKRSLSRQRVVARHRLENLTTATLKTKVITTRRKEGMADWLRRWLPWFPTPIGGRI